MTRKKWISTDQTLRFIREHLFFRAIRGLFDFARRMRDFPDVTR
jgi:hypothetical protein